MVLSSSSSLRGSRRGFPLTILAVAIAVTLIGVLVSRANAETTECGTITTTDKECKADLKPGDIFNMDCNDASDTTNPAALLALAGAKVCEASSKWTKAETTCVSNDERTQTELALKGVGIAAASNKITITNAAYGGDNMTVNGSCLNTAKTKSAYFNVTLMSGAIPGHNGSLGAVILAVLGAGFLTMSH